jgi:cytochrome c-type biogenesis protein CcmH/NrfF
VEILLWLLPAVVVTGAAMVWVGWIGRDRPERERTAVEQQRFAEAVMRQVPDERRRPRQRERSTGVATRRSA